MTASRDEAARCLTGVIDSLTFDAEHNLHNDGDARGTLELSIRSVIECLDWIKQQGDFEPLEVRLLDLISQLKKYGQANERARQALDVEIGSIRHCISPMQLS